MLLMQPDVAQVVLKQQIGLHYDNQNAEHDALTFCKLYFNAVCYMQREITEITADDILYLQFLTAVEETVFYLRQCLI